MSAAGTPSSDPWVVLARERARYEEQFKSLKPSNGVVTGDQAKGFFLQSQLPPTVLRQIWALADTDCDGKMNINEFSIACKLINLKLRGFEVPKGVPPSLLASLKPIAATNTPPSIPPLPNPALINLPPPRPEPPAPTGVIGNAALVANVAPTSNTNMTGIPTGIVPPMQQPLIGSIQPLTTTPIVGANLAQSPPLLPGFHSTGGAPIQAGIQPVLPMMPNITPIASGAGQLSPLATSTPRASFGSLERTASVESTIEWAVPHQTKLKYTQTFNTIDRTRTGYLSGPQARNVMIQTKLSQNILAQIWALADMDHDGRLGTEEFVLAMHFCEQALLGHPIPTKLPADLVPPSFRRTARTTSISSQGSAAPVVDQEPSSMLISQNSFEDKRKENYEKGQAELERRRKQLLEQQKKEAEERERKEREEIERREKARQEAERKRMEELEKQMREQQEKERLIEEDRKRQAEMREAARKEMERQRQLEWEKQRLQDLEQQHQKEQEHVLKLKAKNQSLTIELTSLNDQIKELSHKICDTRVDVSKVKTTIDGMRSTRDTQMQEMSQLKNKLKDQNARLLALSHEKAKIEAKNKANLGDDVNKLAFDNKEITMKNLKEKITDIQGEIDGKLNDIDNNNAQLSQLKTQLTSLLGDCGDLYSVYESKRTQVLTMRNHKVEDAWAGAANWGDDSVANNNNDWGSQEEENGVGGLDLDSIPGVHKYRAIYEFVARNNDEISFQPGDIIRVPEQQTGEPGWLAGEIRGHTGWFPESYVEAADGVGIQVGDVNSGVQDVVGVVDEVAEATKLEGIEEVPESTEIFTGSSGDFDQNFVAPAAQFDNVEPEYYIANYAYQSQEPGDLIFNAGDVIGVYKKDGDWWTGKLDNCTGIFPSNYVQKVDVTSTTSASSVAPEISAQLQDNVTAAPIEDIIGGVSAAAITSALESVQNAQVDNEVSEINENKHPNIAEPRPLDSASISSATQVKGKKPEIASVIAPYQASSPEQLSLARGQLIMIRKKTDSGWWEGELQAKGRKRQVGWFPASYVKVLNSSGRISGRTTPVSTTRMQQEVVIDKVVALYPYTAGNPDELSFAKDDIISVTARDEEAWWKGELNGVSGLFPSNYVAPLQSHSKNKKRLESINELIQTEKAYVEDMSIVHRVFELPLRQSRIISEENADEIFVNWQDILVCNKNFLLELTQAFESGSVVGDVICRHLPRMTAYITFCGKQLDSANLLQTLTETSSAFRELVKKCQNHVATKGMPLSSFLIKPMQRITRYPLLIGKILANTPPEHEDYTYLQESLKIAEKFLSCVNENVRQRENQKRMDWLQQNIQNDLNLLFNSNTNKLGPRQLLHFGVFTKLKNNKDLIGFLFNDFFLLVQPSKSLGTQFTFQRNCNVIFKMYKQPIFVNSLTVTRESSDNVEAGTDSNRVLRIQDEKSGYKILLLSTTVNECSLWMKKMDAAKEMFTKIYNLSRQNKRKTQLHLGPTIGRLLVFVQKGKRLISTSGKHHSESIYCRVTLGNQEQETDFAKDTLNNGNIMPNTSSGSPQIPNLVWNYSMQFQLRNLTDEVLTFVVMEQNPFSLDEFLGRAELKLQDIYKESQNTNGPLTKKLILHQVESGEIAVKLDLHMFNNY